METVEEFKSAIKTNWKKYIAREVLILFGTGILILIAVILNKPLENLLDDVLTTRMSTHLQSRNELIEEYTTKYPDSESIHYRGSYPWHIRITTDNEVKTAMEKSIYHSIKNYEKAKSDLKKWPPLIRKASNENYSSIFILFLVYPLRLSFFLLKWALQLLKWSLRNYK